MKKIVFLFCIMIVASQMNAQLLKKLKEKAEKVVAPKKEDTKANENNGNEENAKTNSKVKWQPTSDCDKLFTLEKGEKFFYDETKVIAKNGKLSYSFVISNKNYEYFLVEDGVRTGPFKEAPTTQMQIKSDKNDEEGNGNDDNEKIDLGNDKKDPVAQQYSKTISNKLYIVFNGKNYGPYDYVAKMKVSPDKKKFWAAVVIGGTNEMLAKMGMGNSFLVNESGVKQKGGDQSSFAAKMMVSSNFNAAALSILDNAAQKAITITSTGKKEETSVMDLYANNGSAMIISNKGDIISVPSQSPTQLMVNGEEAASFKVPITSLSRLYIMEDYKKSIFYKSGKLYRGDGSEESLSGITFPKFATINNVTSVYYYKIHETDTGDKDVYLCKKVL